MSAKKNYYTIRRDLDKFSEILRCSKTDDNTDGLIHDNNSTNSHNNEEAGCSSSLISRQVQHIVCDIRSKQTTFFNDNRDSVSHDLTSENSLSGNSDEEFNSSHSYISETSTSNVVNNDLGIKNQVYDEKYLVTELASLYNQHNMTHACFRDILALLRNYHDIPADPRTILRTESCPKESVGDGSLVYFGIEENIKKYFQFHEAEISSLKLDINIDGLPIYNSVGISFWPILCSISNSIPFQVGASNPFIVAIYSGKKKPEIHGYLNKFCTELKELLDNGIRINNRNYSLEIRSVIADAPAKAFIKQIKSHGGYFACDRCMVQGTYDKNVRAVSYIGDNVEKRTDNSFRAKVQLEHHVGISPFLVINSIDMVKVFVIDYMHVVLLGIMKKLLKCWVQFVPFKLSSAQKAHAELTINKISKFIPCEFNRKPRSLTELDRYKATEFRLILMYTGAVMFKDLLKEKLFNNFLLLMYIIRTLCSQNCVNNTDILSNTEQLCVIFVRQFRELYGTKLSVGLNVHSLIHIVDDVRRLGVLDSFSAFPYETMLGRLKKRIRSSNQPLSQISRRLSEGLTFFINRDNAQSKMTSSSKVFQVNNYKIIPGSFKNSCVLLDDNSVGIVESVADHNTVIIKKFVHQRPAFLYPYTFENVDMYLTKKKITKVACKQEEIISKCVILPFKDGYMVISML